VERITGGFTLAFIMGVVTVLAMRKSEFWLRFFQVFVTLGLTVPALAWSAIAVMLFGLDSGAAIFTVAVVTFPTIATTLFEGVKSLDRDLLELAKVYRLNRWDRFRLVVFPHLTSYLFAACRSGVGLAWKAVVITEMIGLSSGLGYQISVAYGLLSMQDVLAWTLLFSAAMIGFEYFILQQAERHLLRWKPQLPRI
jgi:NitT/TauT family transport system permease protein